MLFHLTTREAWRHAVAIGEYTTPGPFIHLSTETQWPITLARWFADATDLLLLVIDPERVRDEIRYELADGEAFPHLYGVLTIEAVVEVREV
ncbi:MAG TPA: DUF952 domain-containing protein [Kofleriaceae bacterium]|nr:DUF952 domain-containing protein [Kofleriaceae bacterium]